MKTYDIAIINNNGKKGKKSARGGVARGVEIPLKNAVLVLITAKKGFIMCGYLDIKLAEKLGDAACIVRGVKNVNDMLNGKVAELTTKAAKLGVKPGMAGAEALKKLR